MEIPKEYKELYKHWEYHTKERDLSNTEVKSEYMEDIKGFCIERMKIWEKKYSGSEPPYTEDEVLSKYRFCNIYRELDRQTIEIHRMLKPFESDINLWLLNVAYLRFVCRPDTVKKTGFLSFENKNNERVLKRLKSLASPKYGTAYIFPISTIQRSDYPTREEFFCKYLPIKIPEIVSEIEKFKNIGVSDALEKVLPVFSFNFRFHWTEILIDTAYQYPQYIDLFKRFPIGPGSMPTMKLLSNGDPEETCLRLSGVYIDDFPYLTYEGKKVLLSAENWEGIGCEFRKYSHLKKGFGRVRKFC